MNTLSTTAPSAQLDMTIPPEDALEHDVQLLVAAGQTRKAWDAGDRLSARRWSLCLALLLMEHAEAAGFAIWDGRQAVTAQRRAGHEAWIGAWRLARGGADDDGPGVDDLLSLVALFLSDTLPAAA